MTLTMLLALRPLWLEKRLGGLDKMYRLHKHTGIASGITIGLHWLIVKAGPWAVSQGLVESARRSRGSGLCIRSLAVEAGNWSMYMMLFLIAASLIRLVTYKRFTQIHKLGGIIFLFAAFHSVLLMPSGEQYQWVWFAALAFSIAGCVFACISLTGKIGVKNKVSGIVSLVTRPAPDLVLFQVKLEKPINYQPGQFSYIDFMDGEKPHPFTFVDYNRKTGIAEFAIKALGDYTTKLVDTLQNQAVAVEGPYGQFLYPNHKQQIWIGAGIGITPFIAMAESLARQELPHAYRIRLYYRVHALQDAVFHSRLIELACQIPGFEVILLASDQGDSLNAEDIARDIPLLNEYQVCFCGPVSFGDALESELVSKGLPKAAFKKEFFEFR